MHVFVFGACLCRFRLCPGHVCASSFCSGPCLCRFLVLWALCVNSLFVWALRVGFLLRLGVVRFTNITQTQKQPTQNKAQNRRVHAMSPKQKKSTERGPRHKRNLHKQSPEHTEFTQAGPRRKRVSQEPLGHTISEGSAKIWGTPVAQGSVTQGSRGHKTSEKQKNKQTNMSGGLLWPSSPLPRGPGCTKPWKTKNVV